MGCGRFITNSYMTVSGLPGALLSGLMCKLDFKGVVHGKVPRTTRPKAETMRPADLVNRTFSAERTNQHWVADITYLKTHAGWVYAVFVIDVFSCMIVGWQTSTHLYTELALDALNMAVLHQQHAGDDLSGLASASLKIGVCSTVVWTV